MEARKNFVIALIGANATGKTTITKKIIQEWKRTRPMQKVIAFDVYDQFGGLPDMRIKLNKTWATSIDSKIRNSLIVLDDYKLLVDGYTPTEGMRDLFINRKQHNNDYIYSCHSPNDVLPQIVPFTTHFYIFFTRSLQGTFKERLPSSDLLITASSFVNKYVSVYGLGKHPNDPDFWSKENQGQEFPYFIVEPDAPEAKRVRGFNMKRKLVINH